MSGIWPEGWGRSVFLALPMGGDAGGCGGCRAIALVPHASEILLHRIMAERLGPRIERELPAEQAGFVGGEVLGIGLPACVMWWRGVLDSSEMSPLLH